MRRELIFTIDNESIVLGSSPYFFDSIQGLSSVDADVSTATAIYQDGVQLINTTLKERVITVNGRIRGNDRAEAFKFRRQAIHILSAKRQLGKLVVRYSDGTEYYIEAMCRSGVEITEQNIDSIQNNVFEYSIEFYCPNPYWKQEEVFETHFTQVIPLWEFETEIDLDDDNSFKFGEVLHDQTTILNNKGDIPTGFYCLAEGKFTNYFVLKHISKNKQLKVVMNFDNVKAIEIFSHKGKKKIYIIYKDGLKELGYKYLTSDSDFFELHAGDNSLRFDTDSRDVELQVKIEHKNLFAGI